MEETETSYPLETVCSVPGASDGIYVLQIVVEAPADASDSGLNRYSVGVTTGAQIYGLGDFSIYNNVEGVTSFDIAEVPDYYAGKTLVIELFDPGESSLTGTLEVIAPNVGGVAACRVYARENSPTADWTQHADTCSESVSPDEYHGRWLKFEVDLAADYTCSECWFRMRYNYVGTISDTTTWAAYMLGDPLRLVPNP